MPEPAERLVLEQGRESFDSLRHRSCPPVNGSGDLLHAGRRRKLRSAVVARALAPPPPPTLRGPRGCRHARSRSAARHVRAICRLRAPRTWRSQLRRRRGDLAPRLRAPQGGDHRPPRCALEARSAGGLPPLPRRSRRRTCARSIGSPMACRATPSSHMSSSRAASFRGSSETARARRLIGGRHVPSLEGPEARDTRDGGPRPPPAALFAGRTRRAPSAGGTPARGGSRRTRRGLRSRLAAPRSGR